MKTNVYVDGFNFYYGMFKRPRWLPWKWLDFYRLSLELMPGHDINRIRYFTADVTAPPDNPHQAVRQQTYFRALRTIPDLTIHKGKYQSNPKRQPAIHPIPIPQMEARLSDAEIAVARRILNEIKVVEVLNTEEKGSDVNLGSYLLLDAFDNDCEAAVVISNDSDLATPLRFARDRCGVKVWVFNPHPGKPALHLKNAAAEHRSIRPNVLERCLFPDLLHDSTGRAIHKPTSWTEAELQFLAKRQRSF